MGEIMILMSKVFAAGTMTSTAQKHLISASMRISNQLFRS
jgi:hypothetical protein